jgi:hypothetical protein
MRLLADMRMPLSRAPWQEHTVRKTSQKKWLEGGRRWGCSIAHLVLRQIVQQSLGHSQRASDAYLTNGIQAAQLP